MLENVKYVLAAQKYQEVYGMFVWALVWARVCVHVCARFSVHIYCHMCLLWVSVCIQFKVKHAKVGLRLRKGVSPVRLPPNSIQRCKYWLCARCTHWRTLTACLFKGKRINSRFALILCLFADSMFVQQLHTDEIETSGLLTIIHVNQLLHGNISERAAQTHFYTAPPPNIHFIGLCCSFFLIYIHSYMACTTTSM